MAQDTYMEDELSMNEVVHNLWLGDLHTAMNTRYLRERNIHSVLSAMRGTVKIAETFNRLQISLDDTEEEDLLKHLATAIAFIQAELDKGRGVLVHCLAGISRSTSIIAAYLMYSQGLTPEDALALIRKARPIADPNNSFLAQLQIFHQASCLVSKHDKATRMFYLERMVKGIVSGESAFDPDALAPAPSSAVDRLRAPSNEPRRRIRCKMCRTELASREHMVDHGQFSAPSPAVSFSPVVSSPSPSSVMSRRTPSDPLFSPTEEETLETPITPPVDPAVIDEGEEFGRQLSEKVTLVESEDGQAPESSVSEQSEPAKPSSNSVSQAPSASPPNSRPPFIPPSRRPPTSNLSHPSNLSAQLYDNPVLAGLRPGLTVVPTPSPSLNQTPRPNSSLTASPPAHSSSTLISAKCSGYFVEPVKWMEPFLEKGELSGKIFCPNKKCNAKLGNYDWAGVCCSCKEWIVPGFCIHRSKVDEIV